MSRSAEVLILYNWIYMNTQGPKKLGLGSLGRKVSAEESISAFSIGQ